MLPAIQCQIPGDLSEEGPEHGRTLRWNRTPGPEPGIVYTLLTVLVTVEYVHRDRMAVLSVFLIRCADRAFRPREVEVEDILIVHVVPSVSVLSPIYTGYIEWRHIHFHKNILNFFIFPWVVSPERS